MASFTYDNRGGIEDWKKIEEYAMNLKGGLWEWVCKKPTRTPRQNRTIHAVFPDLARELNGIGIEMKFGNFSASFTENTAKEFFIEIYLAGKRTSKCTTKELADALTTCIVDINARGGQLAVKNGDWRIMKQLENE